MAREDHSGPLVTELLGEAGFVVDGVVVVSADEVEIRNALNTAVIGGVDLVVSVGGTGVTPRDVTPEATRDILDRELLGISEALRASGLSAGIVDAGVSRGLAGISGSTLVVNLAGSRAAVRDGMATLNPLASPDHRPAIQLGDLTRLGSLRFRRNADRRRDLQRAPSEDFAVVPRLHIRERLSSQNVIFVTQEVDCDGPFEAHPGRS